MIFKVVLWIVLFIWNILNLWGKTLCFFAIMAPSLSPLNNFTSSMLAFHSHCFCSLISYSPSPWTPSDFIYMTLTLCIFHDQPFQWIYTSIPVSSGLSALYCNKTYGIWAWLNKTTVQSIVLWSILVLAEISLWLSNSFSTCLSSFICSDIIYIYQIIYIYISLNSCFKYSPLL